MAAGDVHVLADTAAWAELLAKMAKKEEGEEATKDQPCFGLPGER